MGDRPLTPRGGAALTPLEHKTPPPLGERLAARTDVLKDLLREALQAVPEGEMAGFLGARRASARHCARAAGPAIMAATRPPASASWSWRLPGDRSGAFPTALFARCPRSGKARVPALAAMCMCRACRPARGRRSPRSGAGHSFPAPAISQISKGLDEGLARFAGRPLQEGYPYLVLDARYGKGRIDGTVPSQASWQRCTVHFPGNALDCLPGKADDDCLQEPGGLPGRRDRPRVRQGPEAGGPGRIPHRPGAGLRPAATAPPPAFAGHQPGWSG